MSGRYVFLDSGFCVLKGLIVVRKRGVLFAAALIKKHRYWLTKVPGNTMQQHFDGEAVKVGNVDAI